MSADGGVVCAAAPLSRTISVVGIVANETMRREVAIVDVDVVGSTHGSAGSDVNGV